MYETFVVVVSPLLIPFQRNKGLKYIIYVSSEKKYYGEKRPEMEHHIEEDTRLLKTLDKALNENQMTGAADRQKFRQSLDYSKQYAFLETQ